MPAASKAVRLMEIGMEVEEDYIWDKIGANRDLEYSAFLYHSEVFDK